jgi:hypothetical protein
VTLGFSYTAIKLRAPTLIETLVSKDTKESQLGTITYNAFMASNGKYRRVEEVPTSEEDGPEIRPVPKKSSKTKAPSKAKVKKGI